MTRVIIDWVRRNFCYLSQTDISLQFSSPTLNLKEWDEQKEGNCFDVCCSRDEVSLSYSLTQPHVNFRIFKAVDTIRFVFCSSIHLLPSFLWVRVFNSVTSISHTNYICWSSSNFFAKTRSTMKKKFIIVSSLIMTIKSYFTKTINFVVTCFVTSITSLRYSTKQEQPLSSLLVTYHCNLTMSQITWVYS